MPHGLDSVGQNLQQMTSRDNDSDTHPQSLQILVADDNRNHCRVAKRLLESEGYCVHITHTGESAIELFDQIQPDLVILDSMLPNRSGIECLQHIKNHPRGTSTHVLMCSAKSDMQYILKCLDAGAEAFLTKPYATEKLINRAHMILNES